MICTLQQWSVLYIPATSLNIQNNYSSYEINVFFARYSLRLLSNATIQTSLPTSTSSNSLNSEPLPCTSNYKARTTKTHSWHCWGNVCGVTVCLPSNCCRTAQLTRWVASTDTITVQVKDDTPDAEPVHTGPDGHPRTLSSGLQNT
jgi:hypothetical protein